MLVTTLPACLKLYFLTTEATTSKISCGRIMLDVYSFLKAWILRVTRSIHRYLE